MLVRMQRKRISFALLVGMQTGTATLENSMEVPQKTKNRTTLRPSNCTTRYLSRGYNLCYFDGTHAPPMFIAALSTIAKVWKEPKCPSMGEWIKKRWFIYTMEYYSAIEKNEILLFPSKIGRASCRERVCLYV